MFGYLIILKTNLMFKSIFAAAMAASTAQAVTSCDALTSSALTVWNISALTKDSATPYVEGTLSWNYCAGAAANQDYFAIDSVHGVVAD